MEPEIIIIYEPGQIKSILSRFGREKLDKKKVFIVTLEYEIELLLRQRGIPYYSIQKYLKPNNLQNIHSKAAKMLEEWYDSKEMEFFSHFGIRLDKVKGPYLLHYLKEILYYIEIINCILDNYPQIKKLWIAQSGIFLSPNDGPIAPFAYRIPVDIAKLLGEERGISVSILPHNKEELSNQQLRSKVRQTITIFSEQILKIINFLITLTRPPQKLKIFVIDYWRNIRFFIEKMDDVELIMMERREIKNMGWQAWKKRARFHHPKDFLTPEIRKIAKNKQVQFRSIWQEFNNSAKFSKLFYYQGSSFWPVIQQVFDYLICQDASEVISEIECVKWLLHHFSINRALLRVAARDHYYITAKIASQLKIPSIELQHGIVDPERTSIYISPIKVDFYAAYGKLTKQIFIRNHNEPQRIIEVGSPRFDRYLREENIEILRNQLKIDSSHPVILVPAPPLRNSIKPRDFTSYEVVEIFRILARLLNEIPQIQIILKLRPSKMNARFFRKAAKEIFKDKVIITQYEDMKSLLQLSDLVVCGRSTVVLEAILMGKPVVLHPIRGEVSKLPSFKKAGAISFVESLDGLSGEIRRLIFNEKMKKEIVKRAKEFLRKNYSFDGKSSLRLIKLLREKN